MKLRATVAVAAMALVAVFVAGCTSKQGSSQGGGTTSLVGAGSTFVYPIMTRWIAAYQQQQPNVQINYQSIGSGGGIQQMKKGLVAFAASDAALDDAKLKEMPAPVIQLPESAGPVCITYNLPELKQPLRLSGDALANIYLGKITNWQDAAIKKDNPGVALPNTPVAVVHRADGSGTTNIFTTYLSAISADWKQKAGAGLSLSWPVGLGGKGSEGVTGVVKQTPGGIGYVELSYAEENHLPVALVRNAVGQWIKPTPEGTTAAINAFQAELAKDVRTPIVNPPAGAKDAYPISGLTFLILPADGPERAARQQLQSFVTYILNGGQSLANPLHYAPLPDSLKQIDEGLLRQMKAGGQPLP